ncbi:MAG: dTMP kinase [Planctomycetota bacterium]
MTTTRNTQRSETPDTSTINHPQGRLYAIEGIDGVGKSSQIERLAADLRSKNRRVQTTRDPGGTPVGLKLRELLLDSKLTIHRRTEAMLFMASRCEMVESSIIPWLEAGDDVITDRFLLSNVVYQSLASDGSPGPIQPESLWEVGNWSIGHLKVHQTFLLDLPAEVAMQRVGQDRDRMESRGVGYLEAVRQQFLEQAQNSASHVTVLDASLSIDEVTEQMLASLVD